MKLIFVIIFWWLSLLYISSLSLTGLMIPSEKTIYLIILFCLSIFFGGLTSSTKKLVPYHYDNSSKIKKLEKIYNFFYFLTFPFTFIFFMKAIIAMNDIGLLGYRGKAFSTATTVSVVFPSPQVEILYSLIITPLIMLLTFIGIALYALTKKKKFLFLTLTLGLMDAIMLLGRFFVYAYILLLILSIALTKKYSNLKMSSLRSFIILLMTTLFIISYFRSDNKEVDLVDVFNQSVIEYHTLGFLLFDKDFSDENSLLNQKTLFGEATASGILRVPYLVLLKLDKDYLVDWLAAGNHRNDFVDIGNQNNAKFYNAYYTILYTFFIDGGYLLVLIGGYLLGFLLVRFYRQWNYYFKIDSLIYTMYIFYILYFSVFMSQLETYQVQVSLFIFYIVYNMEYKIKNRSVENG